MVVSYFGITITSVSSSTGFALLQGYGPFRNEKQSITNRLCAIFTGKIFFMSTFTNSM